MHGCENGTGPQLQDGMHHETQNDLLREIMLAYALCLGCALVHGFAHWHTHTKHVLPLAGPPLLFFIGREASAGLPWRRLIGPVCAIAGWVGLVLLACECVRRRAADVNPRVPTAQPVVFVSSEFAIDEGVQHGNARETLSV